MSSESAPQQAKQKQSPLNNILIGIAVVTVLVGMQYGPRWLVGYENYWSATDSQNKIVHGEKMLLLDVRTVKEFKGGHIPNSVNMPMNVLKSKIQKNPDAFKKHYQDHTILSICRSDSRATTAARWLQAEGLNVKVLDGGLVAWNKAQLPVVK